MHILCWVSVCCTCSPSAGRMVLVQVNRMHWLAPCLRCMVYPATPAAPPMLHPPEQAVQQLYDSEEEPTPRASVLGTVKRMFGRGAPVVCKPACLLCSAGPAGREQSLLPMALLMLAAHSDAASSIVPPGVCLPSCLPLPPSAMQLATQTSHHQPRLHVSCTRRLGKACPVLQLLGMCPFG